MNYPVSTPAQLRAVLRALRKSSQSSQAELGQRIGVNQKRIARIERAPGVTSFDQIAQIVTALGGRLVIEELSSSSTPAAQRKPKPNASTW